GVSKAAVRHTIQQHSSDSGIFTGLGWRAGDQIRRSPSLHTLISATGSSSFAHLPTILLCIFSYHDIHASLVENRSNSSSTLGAFNLSSCFSYGSRVSTDPAVLVAVQIVSFLIGLVVGATAYVPANARIC